MEPNLDEHEVVKFLVARGGRCTNFELVSNFRGVLNDPHCKAEARLRFKDIINTVGSVVEYQNTKYIELKPGLSPSSYSSPLTQNYQPYWRYRLSTSVLPRLPNDDQKSELVSGDFSDDSSYSSRGRSTSEPHAIIGGSSPADSQAMRQPGYHHNPAIERQHTESHPPRHHYHENHQHPPQNTSKTQFHENYRHPPDYQHQSTRHHENYHNSQDPRQQYHSSQTSLLKHQEQYAFNMEHNKNRLPDGYYETQTPVYRHDESPGLQFQDHHHQYPPGHQRNEIKHNHSSSIPHNKKNQLPTSYQQYETHQYRQPPSYSHHQSTHKPQSALGKAVLQSQEPNSNNCRHQSYEDMNQNFGSPNVEQQFKNQRAKSQNLEPQSYDGRNVSVKLQDTPYRHRADNSYSRNQSWTDVKEENRQHRLSSADLPQALPERRHSQADRNSQKKTQNLVRGVAQSSSDHRKSVPNIQRTDSEITPLKESPTITRESLVSSSQSKAMSREPPPITRESRVPEQLFSRRMESLHGIRASESPIGYSSLPYESPSAYSITDISPKGKGDVDTDDFQTSANLRNVARALFRNPSRGSAYEPCPKPEKINGEQNLPSLSNNFRSDNRSISDKSLNDSDLKGHETVGLLNRPVNSRETPSPCRGSSQIAHDLKGHDQGPPLTSRSKSIDFPRTNSSSGVSSQHSDSNRTLDSQRQSPRTSISSHSISMQSLNSEKELPNHSAEIERNSTPPPLPPDRKKTLPQTPENTLADTNEKEESSLSAVKVRDKVQHFDDMERQQAKRTQAPITPKSVANKENVARTPVYQKGLGIGDDVSISVIDPKLKREWFVKSSQCDYHALSRLLKSEPKLAALKDTAMTALHWASKQGDANVVKLIAGAYKVNPNVKSGYTPVHLATLHKHNMIVHLLVHTYGADPNIRDYSGRRADQYPTDFIKSVAGHETNTNRRPLKQRTSEPPNNAKESSGGFMRIGSLNLRKSTRKSAMFASVRSKNWGSAAELRFGIHSSMRKKLHKSLISAPERITEVDKNDSDSDSTYGFPSKKSTE
ncbi:hypothetical protein JTE90_009744 [Oedothorax gibbosus]|uniref:SOWAHA-C winged helix-turn-helix domain-containing protein n=1 Tax=Oedothorax gibbosus TaxID=931172 RepID=A0AAV6VAM7_9ARAC|nr:hypothetical protein JTE90_009744 [Oedothorax gibbosus]